LTYPLVPVRQLTKRVDSIDPSSRSRPTFRYIDISSIDREQNLISCAAEIAGDQAPSRARQLVGENDVLVSTVRPLLNAVALVPKDLDGEIASTGFCVLRPKLEAISPRYLFYFVRSESFVWSLLPHIRGANYPAVTDGDVKSVLIPLPPLSEQRRIIEILDRADSLRKMRVKVDAKAHRILQAMFIKRFGNPISNPKQWPLEPLHRLGKLDRGRSMHRPRNAPELFSGPYPFVQTGDITRAIGVLTSYTATYSEAGLQQSKIWPKGTLCITIAANIGQTAILGFDACFPDSVVGFVPKEGVHSEYIYGVFQFLQPLLETRAPRLAQRNINLQILRDLNIPAPPSELQEVFATEARLVWRLNSNLNGAKEIGSSLVRNLMHRAFTGQLTVRWRNLYNDDVIPETKEQANALGAPSERTLGCTATE
jgi:type I restriction enzyme S subunit